MARADARAEKLTRAVVILAVAQFAVAVATLVVAIIALDEAVPRVLGVSWPHVQRRCANAAVAVGSATGIRAWLRLHAGLLADAREDAGHHNRAAWPRGRYLRPRAGRARVRVVDRLTLPPRPRTWTPRRRFDLGEARLRGVAQLSDLLELALAIPPGRRIAFSSVVLGTSPALWRASTSASLASINAESRSASLGLRLVTLRENTRSQKRDFVCSGAEGCPIKVASGVRPHPAGGGGLGTCRRRESAHARPRVGLAESREPGGLPRCLVRRRLHSEGRGCATEPARWCTPTPRARGLSP